MNCFYEQLSNFIYKALKSLKLYPKVFFVIESLGTKTDDEIPDVFTNFLSYIVEGEVIRDYLSTTLKKLVNNKSISGSCK